MATFHGFTNRENPPVGNRTLEDAPAALRQQFVVTLYAVADQTVFPGSGQRTVDVDRDLYLDIVQSLSNDISANPQNGKRPRITRDLIAANWMRVYDVIEGLWPKFALQGAEELYRIAVNSLFAVHNVAWDLGTDGKLHRVLPSAAAAQIDSAFADLRSPIYAAALILARDGQAAYDARPRRDREACGNMFDAAESVAKTKFNMPAATFGQVVDAAHQQNRIHGDVIDALRRLNALRNKNFGHGMVTPFELSGPEVDFTYLGCVGAITLFARLP